MTTDFLETSLSVRRVLLARLRPPLVLQRASSVMSTRTLDQARYPALHVQNTAVLQLDRKLLLTARVLLATQRKKPHSLAWRARQAVPRWRQQTQRVKCVQQAPLLRTAL